MKYLCHSQWGEIEICMFVIKSDVCEYNINIQKNEGLQNEAPFHLFFQQQEEICFSQQQSSLSLNIINNITTATMIIHQLSPQHLDENINYSSFQFFYRGQ